MSKSIKPNKPPEYTLLLSEYVGVMEVIISKGGVVTPEMLKFMEKRVANLRSINFDDLPDHFKGTIENG